MEKTKKNIGKGRCVNGRKGKMIDGRKMIDGKKKRSR